MKNLNDNIKSILFELNFPDMFGSKTVFDNNIKDISKLFNDIVKSNFDIFNKTITKLDFSRITSTGSIEDQKAKFVEIMNDSILKIKSGEFFNLPENIELTNLYNKLIAAGIDKEKLNIFIISIYEDFSKVKNMKDLYSEITSSFFRAKIELLQTLTNNQLEKLNSISPSDIKLGDTISHNIASDVVNKFSSSYTGTYLLGKVFIVLVIFVILIIISIVNLIKKKNSLQKSKTVKI